MINFFPPDRVNWHQTQTIPNKAFVCGFCSTKVSSIKGYKLGAHGDGSGQLLGAIYICANCGGPSFFAPDGSCYPAKALGNAVQHVPEDLNKLYEEARRASAQNCYTGAVLICRKMLMNIAVHQGAKEDLKFIEYVNFLAEQGFVPPNGKHWVDHIRKKGNEATHEIKIMKEQDAHDLIAFLEMLLRFIYEFPNMIPKDL